MFYVVSTRGKTSRYLGEITWTGVLDRAKRFPSEREAIAAARSCITSPWAWRGHFINDRRYTFRVIREEG